MNRPEKIWVGSLLYRVVYSKEAVNNIAAPQNKYLLGSTSSSSLVITIDDSSAEQVIRDTLFHEVLHCIWGESGVDTLKDLNDEQLIALLTPRIISLLRVNPELVKYLTRGSKT